MGFRAATSGFIATNPQPNSRSHARPVGHIMGRGNHIRPARSPAGADRPYAGHWRRDGAKSRRRDAHATFRWTQPGHLPRQGWADSVSVRPGLKGLDQAAKEREITAMHTVTADKYRSEERRV